MRTILFVLLLSLLIPFGIPRQTHAEEKASVSSASLAMVSKQPVDTRVKALREYLARYESPLADDAKTFIDEADKHNLDWRFVVAIAGVESYYGQYLPEGSNNGWGWGIYGSNMTSFQSYEEGIKTISKSLREQYMNEWGAKDVYQVGSFYAADPLWASKVTHFMDEISMFKEDYDRSQLSISI